MNTYILTFSIRNTIREHETRYKKKEDVRYITFIFLPTQIEIKISFFTYPLTDINIAADDIDTRIERVSRKKRSICMYTIRVSK